MERGLANDTVALATFNVTIAYAHMSARAHDMANTKPNNGWGANIESDMDANRSEIYEYASEEVKSDLFILRNQSSPSQSLFTTSNDSVSSWRFFFLFSAIVLSSVGLRTDLW